jgi:putative membrane protein
MKAAISFVILLGSVAAGATVARAQSADSDKQFLTKASQSDFTEIKFSQLALEKSTNPTVKSFAQRMVMDHQKLEAEMKPLADQAGVTPVTELDAEHQQKYDVLNQLSGTEFDKTYMTGMDQDHHIALNLFKSEESSAADSKLKATVAKGTKVIAQHTSMADKGVTAMSTMPSSGAAATQ